MDLQYLSDLESIRRLAAHYANLCDDDFQSEALADLFTPDGVWTAEGFGPFEGRAALVDFFNMLGANSLFTLHTVGNEEIDIDGDTAKCRWSTINVNTFKGDHDPEDDWKFLRYDVDFVRTGDDWKFKCMKVIIRASGSNSAGWAASVASS